jgi:zinc-ribbon domain
VPYPHTFALHLKTCTYCGAQNEDTATVCAVCATELVALDSAAERPFVPLYRDPVARFRIVLILSTICYLLYLFGPWVFWRNLSEETYDGLNWAGYGGVLLIPRSVFYVTAALWVFAAVGVYFFVPAALWLYTALTVYTIATTLLCGMVASLAVESFLIYLSNLGDGAILALAYWSPVRDKFAQTADDPGTQ